MKKLSLVLIISSLFISCVNYNDSVSFVDFDKYERKDFDFPELSVYSVHDTSSIKSLMIFREDKIIRKEYFKNGLLINVDDIGDAVAQTRYTYFNNGFVKQKSSDVNGEIQYKYIDGTQRISTCQNSIVVEKINRVSRNSYQLSIKRQDKDINYSITKKNGLLREYIGNQKYIFSYKNRLVDNVKVFSLQGKLLSEYSVITRNSKIEKVIHYFYKDGIISNTVVTTYKKYDQYGNWLEKVSETNGTIVKCTRVFEYY